MLDPLLDYSKHMEDPWDLEGGTVYKDPDFYDVYNTSNFPAGAQIRVDVDVHGVLGNGFEDHEHFIWEDLYANGLTMCTRLVARSEPGHNLNPLTEVCEKVGVPDLGPTPPLGSTPHDGNVTLGPVPMPPGENSYGIQTKLEIPFCYDYDGCGAMASTTSVVVRWGV